MSGRDQLIIIEFAKKIVTGMDDSIAPSNVRT